MPVAVVTGAAGFVGRAVGQRLVQAGWTVRGIDLRTGEVGAPGEILLGDVATPGTWQARLRGADLVVHAAALVAEAGDREGFYRVNVGGTRHVLQAAADHGVRRVVHLSSIVVYGADYPTERPLTEDDVVRPSGGPYTDTKIAAEHQALRIAAETGLDVAIVRPGDVYGPGSLPWTVRPIRLMQQGLFALPGAGRGMLAPTYVDDLTDAVATLAGAERLPGRIYNVNGGVGVPARRFFRYYTDHLGIGLRTLPGPLAKGLALGARTAAKMVGREVPLAPEALEYVSHPGTYSIRRIREELGWVPGVDLDEGMRRTLEWVDRHLR